MTKCGCPSSPPPSTSTRELGAAPQPRPPALFPHPHPVPWQLRSQAPRHSFRNPAAPGSLRRSPSQCLAISPRGLFPQPRCSPRRSRDTLRHSPSQRLAISPHSLSPQPPSQISTAQLRGTARCSPAAAQLPQIAAPATQLCSEAWWTWSYLLSSCRIFFNYTLLLG